MKIIFCENKINGELCGKPRQVKKQAHKAKYCKECAADIHRAQSKIYYRKHKGRLRTAASEASKKYGKPNKNKSSTKRTKCKCPTCGDINYHQIFLYDPEKYESKPFPKRCDSCKALIERDGFCNIAGSHHAVVFEL